MSIFSFHYRSWIGKPVQRTIKSVHYNRNAVAWEFFWLQEGDLSWGLASLRVFTFNFQLIKKS